MVVGGAVPRSSTSYVVGGPAVNCSWIPPRMGGNAAGLALGGSPGAGGLGRPVALRPASCSVPRLEVRMAALMGLAAARSRGEYTSDWILAAAVLNGLNNMRSPGLPGVVRLKFRPSICCAARAAASVSGVDVPFPDAANLATL